MDNFQLKLLLIRELKKLDKPSEWAALILESVEGRAQSTGLAFDMLDKIRAGQHIARIIGYTYFDGRRFDLYPDALIPRPDTEILVHSVKKLPKDAIVVDWCAGSGCVGLSLALDHPEAKYLLFDYSAAACHNVRANINRYHLGGKATIIQANLMDHWPFGQVDVIVSNPPYIPSRHPVMKDLRDDPVMALDGGVDGLIFIKRIIEVALLHLNPGGSVYIEIGYDQAEKVCLLAKANQWQYKIHNDLADRARVVELWR